MATGVYAGKTLPDNGLPMLLLDAAGIAAVAGLRFTPVIAAAAVVEEVVPGVPALLFDDLDGQRRAIALAVIDRVEPVPTEAIRWSGGALRLSIGETIIPLHAVAELGARTEVAVLRLTDGESEMAYAIAEAIEIVALPTDMAPARGTGPIAGVVMIAGEQIEPGRSACAVRRAAGDARLAAGMPVAGRRIGLDGDVPETRARSVGLSLRDGAGGGRDGGGGAGDGGLAGSRDAGTGRDAAPDADRRARRRSEHLSVRPAGVDRRARSTEGDVSELFLVAHVAGRGVAIAASQVESVVDIGEIVAVPRAEAFVRGLAALRSRVVTVIDTGTALGLAPTPDDVRRAVITIFEGHHYAILVDSVEDVAPSERLPLSSGMALHRGWASAGIGIVERDGEPLLILDLAAIISDTALAA
ncbi:chemotaxis protein CheW [Sphingomonas aurantiaca]|uniref:chemotaxis protein CheW n=1 Tax=Sphingomonas aurantiaca TaxID=185949 RepID=UPI002FE23894